MREIALLAIAITAFAGAALVPDGPMDFATEGAPADTAIADTAAYTASDPQAGDTDSYAAWVAGATELPRAADGHFYADANINGTRLIFLIDTGASIVALTGTDARAAGLFWSPADIRPVGRGASGPVHGVEVSLDRVTLGGHEARNVRAVIVPDGLAVSLLGQSFLTTIQPVRIEGDRMVLGE